MDFDNENNRLFPETPEPGPVPEPEAPETGEEQSEPEVTATESEIRAAVNSAVEEIQELASAEAEQWDYLPKPPKKLRKRGHYFAQVFFSFLIVYVILFAVSARLVFGKGWLRNMISGTEPGAHFTLPVADVPELDGRFYQEDGRFTVEGVYEAVSPSIVTIESYNDDSAFAPYGQGSGIIMTEDGYIITNAHVIEEATLMLKVRTRDGDEFNATVVGSDVKTDIAVIKIDANGLQPAQFGNSDQVLPGEQVVAIGSPAGLESSVTTGIVSGVDRMIKVEATNLSMSCIQIDAAINPGNSGGALLNMWGQVVGITSSKLDALEYDNIGFAIEMSAARPIIEQLIENGRILGRTKIGISFYEISDANAEFYGTPAGLEIADISPDCDIANTELEIGDYITEMNGVPVRSADDVYEIIFALKPGDEITAKVVRVLPVKGNDDPAELKTREFEIVFKLMPDDSEFVETVDDPEPEEGDSVTVPEESEE